jgi:hypothetical protein
VKWFDFSKMRIQRRFATGGSLVLKSVPAGRAAGSGDAFPVCDSEAEGIKIAVSEAALTLNEHSECHVSVCLYSGDALSSIALASWGVPNCPCCANVVDESISAAADAVAMANVRAMDRPPVVTHAIRAPASTCVR